MNQSMVKYVCYFFLVVWQATVVCGQVNQTASVDIFQCSITKTIAGFQLVVSGLSDRASVRALEGSSPEHYRHSIDYTTFTINGDAEDTTFIILHFSNLPESFEMRVIPESSEGAEEQIYDASTVGEGPFSTPPMPGSSLTLVFKKGVTFTLQTIELGSAELTQQCSDKALQQGQGGMEEVCTKDSSSFKFTDLNVKCWPETSAFYQTSKALSRLVVKGGYICTGFLISPLGLLMTNHHCIKDQNDASAASFEFGAEAPDCSSQNGQMKYGGKVVVKGATWLASDSKLDYSIVLLSDSSKLAEYGYMKIDFSSSSPRQGMGIYLPQHPNAFAKVIGWLDGTRGMQQSVLTSVDLSPCTGASGTKELGYMIDTEVGSSGSPLIDKSTHQVIGIHHCGGCPNKAVAMYNLRTPITKALSSQCFRHSHCQSGLNCTWRKLGDTCRCGLNCTWSKVGDTGRCVLLRVVTQAPFYSTQAPSGYSNGYNGNSNSNNSAPAFRPNYESATGVLSTSTTTAPA
eukprot:g10760.t1